MRPKISIIVPCYKVEHFIDRCMNSIAKQTLSDIEIILVDDKSPDGTPQKCDEWGRRDPRVKVIHKLQNQGLGYARNSGLEIATGEYVAFVDSDDFVDVNMYKSLYEFANNNKLDAVFCGYKKYYNESKINERQECDKYCINEGKNNIDNILKDIIASEPSHNSDAKILSSVWKCLFSMSIIKNNNLSFVSERTYIAEDVVFYIDFLPCCNRIGFIPQAYYYYCVNDASLTQSFKEDRFLKEIVLVDEIEKRIEEKGFVLDEFIERIDRYLLLKLRVCIRQYLQHSNKESYFSKRRVIKEMIMNQRIRCIVERYPYYEMDYAHKTFFLLAKYHLIDLIIILLKIQNTKIAR